MNDRQRKMMFELFTGTIISQEIIIQTLHRNGLLKKGDIVERLDYFIEYFERRGADQIAVPMRYLKKNLDKQLPSVPSKKVPAPTGAYPEWFQGVIPGGRSAPRGATVQEP